MDELGPFLDIFRVFGFFGIYTLRKKSGRTGVTLWGLMLKIMPLIAKNENNAENAQQKAAC